jgi:hypothetical protein
MNWKHINAQNFQNFKILQVVDQNKITSNFF